MTRSMARAGTIRSRRTGRDKFIFDPTGVSAAGYDDITDYDHGSGGAFNAAEGDQLDLSALLAGYNRAPGRGIAPRPHHRELERQHRRPRDRHQRQRYRVDQHRGLDGIQLGNSVNVILDASLPAGTTLTTTGPASTFTGAAGNLDWNGVLTDKNSGGIIHTNWSGAATRPHSHRQRRAEYRVLHSWNWPSSSPAATLTATPTSPIRDHQRRLLLDDERPFDARQRRRERRHGAHQ